MVSDGTNTYEYDAEGNLTAEDMADGTFIWYAWDQRNRLVSVTYADVYGTPVSGVNYTYDAFNQLIAREVWGESSSAFAAEVGGENSMRGGFGINAVDPGDVTTIYVYDNLLHGLKRDR